MLNYFLTDTLLLGNDHYSVKIGGVCVTLSCGLHVYFTFLC